LNAMINILLTGMKKTNTLNRIPKRTRVPPKHERKLNSNSKAGYIK